MNLDRSLNSARGEKAAENLSLSLSRSESRRLPRSRESRKWVAEPFNWIVETKLPHSMGFSIDLIRRGARVI